jgi:hypothetical protein
VKNITFIKGYQKAYPEVIPHCHLGIPIGIVKNKSIVSPRPQESAHHRCRGPRQDSANARGCPEQHLATFDIRHHGNKSPPIRCRTSQIVSIKYGAKIQNESKYIIKFSYM